MKVRFGFVAMALSLQNASPSQTMTLKTLRSIPDREAALQKATRIAEKNLHNTLRILRHANASGVEVYRFSSKLIPLYGLEETADWDFIGQLGKPLEDIGAFVKDKEMRVSFHPDHFVVLNSPKDDVLVNSIANLEYHVAMLEAMGLDELAKLVLHVGGKYTNKELAIQRFIENWPRVPTNIQRRITLENDDKTYTAKDVQYLCGHLGVPMVFDVHHHLCNHEEGVVLADVAEEFVESWEGTGLRPKAHISSPKDASHLRAHADNINPDDLVPFLDLLRSWQVDVDVMVEAKRKDEAVFALVRDLAKRHNVTARSEGTIDYH